MTLETLGWALGALFEPAVNIDMRKEMPDRA
jgi:hypothetical protein